MGHGHHHHEEHAHTSQADSIIKALRGQGDKGAVVTILGLLVNVGLTVLKGAAGWYLNSAVLLADAGHSLSDLLGDIVTLFFYTLSRRAPSSSYPYGYGKFESLGTSIVAAFLLLGGWAIGVHAYDQLVHSTPLLEAYLPSVSHFMLLDSHHVHAHSVPDLHAAWVAVISILVKEGMYRLSAAAATSQNSPVLMANALHHRSDMYSSFVGLVAIVGNWVVPTLPLDPIGGLLVTILILHQAFELFRGSLFELTDHSVDPDLLRSISKTLLAEIGTSSLSSSVSSKSSDIRGIRRGAHLFIDATLDISNSGTISVADAVKLEDAISRRVRAQNIGVKDIRLRLAPVEL